MKHTTKVVVTTLAMIASLGLTSACGANGISGTVENREHELCGMELSMSPVTYTVVDGKGGGGKSSSSGSSKPKKESKPKPKKSSGKSCSESWELEVRNSDGLHEINVGRTEWEQCMIGAKYPKCAN